MGQVTIFEKEGCVHCKRVQEMLEKFKGCVMNELKDSNSPIKPEIVIKTVDCGKEVAYAAFCIRATGTFTVPHVFFNEEYVGSADKFLSLDMTCKGGYNVLRNKLIGLAQQPCPDPEFPPPPEAAMVKVTDELAFSTQPTTRQLSALHTIGLKSVLNILRSDSPAFHQGEDKLVEASGVKYVASPMFMVTPRNLEKAMDTLCDMPKPVLVHDDTGSRACLVTLMVAARQMNSAAVASSSATRVDWDTISGWARGLGYDLKSFQKSVETLLSSEAEKANAVAAGSAAPGCSKADGSMAPHTPQGMCE